MRIVVKVKLPNPLRKARREKEGSQERRRFERHDVSGTGLLYWQSPTGDMLGSPVTVRDWSELGLQVETPKQIPIESKVRLVGEQVQCIGSTRYCHLVSGQYRVGIELIQRPHFQGVEAKGQTSPT